MEKNLTYTDEVPTKIRTGQKDVRSENLKLKINKLPLHSWKQI